MLHTHCFADTPAHLHTASQTEVQSLKARLADKPPAAGSAGSSEAAAAAAAGGIACSYSSSDNEAGLNAAISGCAVGAVGGAGSALSSGAAVCSSAEAETLAWIDALAHVGVALPLTSTPMCAMFE
jgi:hypothetical protein